MNEEYFMKEALKEARKAYDLGEVPVGAIVVCENEIVSSAYNTRETDKTRFVTQNLRLLTLPAKSSAAGGFTNAIFT